MEPVATRLCLDTLSATFEEWRKRLGSLPEHEIKEYQEPIDTVLDVATQFSVFNREAIKDLDEHLTPQRYASLDSEFTVDVYQGGRYNPKKTTLHGSCSFQVRDLTDNLAVTTECESYDGILLWLRSRDSFGDVGD